MGKSLSTGPSVQNDGANVIKSSPSSALVSNEVRKIMDNAKMAIFGATIAALAALNPISSAKAETMQVASISIPDLNKGLSTLDPVSQAKVSVLYQNFGELQKANQVPNGFLLRAPEVITLGQQPLKTELQYIENDLSLSKDKGSIDAVLGFPYKKIDILGDPEGYRKLVEALFDPTEVKDWYRVGEEKRMPTQEELDKFLKGMDSTKKRWLARETAWKTQIDRGVVDAKVFSDASDFFDQTVKNMRYFSTESVRLAFVTSLSTAFNANIRMDTEDGRKNKQAQAVDISTNLSWLATLGNKSNKPYTFLKVTVVDNRAEQKITLFGNNMLEGSDLSFLRDPRFKDVGVNAAEALVASYNTSLNGYKVDERYKRSVAELEQITREVDQGARFNKLSDEIGKLDTEIGALMIRYLSNPASNVVIDGKEMSTLDAIKQKQALASKARNDFYNLVNVEKYPLEEQVSKDLYTATLRLADRTIGLNPLDELKKKEALTTKKG